MYHGPQKYGNRLRKYGNQLIRPLKNVFKESYSYREVVLSISIDLCKKTPTQMTSGGESKIVTVTVRAWEGLL